jgi:hypothetical protein
VVEVAPEPLAEPVPEAARKPLVEPVAVPVPEAARKPLVEPVAVPVPDTMYDSLGRRLKKFFHF